MRKTARASVEVRAAAPTRRRCASRSPQEAVLPEGAAADRGALHLSAVHRLHAAPDGRAVPESPPAYAALAKARAAPAAMRPTRVFIARVPLTSARAARPGDPGRACGS